MSCANVMIYIIGILTILSALIGWFGQAVWAGLWWDMVRIDFPEMGGEYLSFYVVLLLNWSFPALFVVSTFFSVVLDKFSSGNVVGAFFSALSFVSLFGGFVTVPIIINWSSKEKCTTMFNSPANQLSENTVKKFNEWMDYKTKGMTPEQVISYTDNFDSTRCENAQIIEWIFLGLQLASILLVLLLTPLYIITNK